MKYIYSGIYLFFTTLHLVATYRKDRHRRNFSKGYILLALLGFYLEAAGERRWTVILALLFSWIGDLLLTGTGTVWFMTGGFSFFLSHVFFMISYTRDADLLSVPGMVRFWCGVAFLVTVLICFSKLTGVLPKKLFWPMLLYLLVNGAMNCFAVYRAFAAPSLKTVLTMLGAFLFFLADTRWFFIKFDENSTDRSHFPVMTAYSLGMLMIVMGLI